MTVLAVRSETVHAVMETVVPAATTVPAATISKTDKAHQIRSRSDL